MSVNTYTRGQKQQLTEHFNISEFHCKGAKCGCTETLHDPALSAYLQQIRVHFDKPLYITSGFRCEKHNQVVGGVVGSLHTKGMAADIVIQGVKPLEIAQYAELIGVKGIGLYDQFVHIDTREFLPLMKILYLFFNCAICTTFTIYKIIKITVTTAKPIIT